MNNTKGDQPDWQAVVDAHPLESHVPEDWLLYGVSLLQIMEPGPDLGKQLQQAALAFVQAEKEGASADAVGAAQQHAVLISLQRALAAAGMKRTAQNLQLQMDAHMTRTACAAVFVKR